MHIIYVCKGREFETWEECHTTCYPNVSFPPEDGLTQEIMVRFGITRKEIEPTVEEKKYDVRQYRDSMLQDSDKYMLPDFPITEEERADRIVWRSYLRNYTESGTWWEQYPKTFEEFIEERRNGSSE